MKRLILITGIALAVFGCAAKEDTGATGMDGAATTPKGDAVAGVTPAYSEVDAIFKANCLKCHNSTRSSGGLNVSTHASVTKEVVVAGDPAGSEIIQYLRGIKKPQMPFKGAPLPEEQIVLIENWIKGGAKA